MGFAEIMAAGVALMESECGVTFEIDGRPGTFTGVINSHTKAGKLGVGGYGDDGTSILMASKPQFGVEPPVKAKRVTVEGERYVIDSVERDSSTYSLTLIGLNK